MSACRGEDGGKEERKIHDRTIMFLSSMAEEEEERRKELTTRKGRGEVQWAEVSILQKTVGQSDGKVGCQGSLEVSQSPASSPSRHALISLNNKYEGDIRREKRDIHVRIIHAFESVSRITFQVKYRYLYIDSEH